VSAIFHHQDLLLDDAKVVALLKLDHLDGGKLPRRDTFRLERKRERG
jgi:hypothetical protein